MIEIVINLVDGYTTKIENASLSEFEFIKKEIKNPFVSVICSADTVIVKKHITRVYYTKKELKNGKRRVY